MDKDVKKATIQSLQKAIDELNNPLGSLCLAMANVNSAAIDLNAAFEAAVALSDKLAKERNIG